jgi:hypothetical protein
MIIKYKNINYKVDEEFWGGEQLSDSPQFIYEQLKYAQDTGDYVTLENRINNMLKWGGIKKLKK